MNAVIYTKSACPFCVSAKQLLEMKNIPYTEINIESEGNLKVLMEVVPGAKTVPQIFIDNEYVGGFKQLKERFDNERTLLHG